MSFPQILVVDDDPAIGGLIARYLRDNDCAVACAADGREMARLLAARPIDLVVLDLMLPGDDGLELCRRLREESTVPILMLTARGEEIDRILGLEMGADDYLTKPFNPRELLARIRAVLRRAAHNRPDGRRPPRTLLFAGWRLDLGLRRLLNRDGVMVSMTGAEFELLRTFCERPGEVLSRDQLLSLTQGRALPANARSIDILVSRIRQKTRRHQDGPDFIRTVRSGGYLFVARIETA